MQGQGEYMGCVQCLRIQTWHVLGEHARGCSSHKSSGKVTARNCFVNTYSVANAGCISFDIADVAMQTLQAASAGCVQRVLFVHT